MSTRAANAVGLKTILAYRGGFEIDPSPPSSAEVVEAAGRWLAEIENGQPRLTDRTLLRYGIWAGAGFTGSVDSLNGNGNYTIGWQNLTPDSTAPCSSDIQIAEDPPN